jgi:hypothetical protein
MLSRVSLGLIASALLSAAGCGGGGDDTTVVKDVKLQTHRPSGHPFNTVAAQMVSSPDPAVSEMDMPRITNGWTVEDHHQTTSVIAGAGNPPETTGLFAVYRLRVKPFKDGTDLVEVPGAGPLTITKAPLGGKVAHSAQQHGDIEFTSKNGVTGVLHLSDDTVTRSP